MANTQTVIDISPSADAAAAVSLVDQSRALVIVDHNSHRNALSFIRDGKTLKRAIVAHWAPVKQGIDALKRTVLDLERKDVDPVDRAIAYATTVALDFERVEAERVRFAEQEAQRVAEEKAARERATDLAAQEAQAAALEENSPELSAREQAFVDAYVLHPDSLRAAAFAGYKHPGAQAHRLLNAPKILAALAAKQQALDLRRHAEVLQARPLDVVVEKVESNVATFAGVSTRSTWSAEVVDFEALLASLGVTDTARAALVLLPNTVFLNAQAKALHANIGKVYQGVRAVEKKGIAG